MLCGQAPAPQVHNLSGISAAGSVKQQVSPSFKGDFPPFPIYTERVNGNFYCHQIFVDPLLKCNVICRAQDERALFQSSAGPQLKTHYSSLLLLIDIGMNSGTTMASTMKMVTKL